MDQAINDVFEIIKDYREGEDKMSIERITLWINQFDEEDRLFLLTELKNLLSKRYFSKKGFSYGIEKIFIDISKHYGYETPAALLKDAAFILNQPKGKSQFEMMEVLYEISNNKFEFDIKANNPEKPKFFIYLDDILCTGDSLFKALIKQSGNQITGGWLYEKMGDLTHLDYLKANDSKLVILNFVIHEQNYTKFAQRLYMALNKQSIDKYYTAWAFEWVENDSKKPSAKLNFVYPLEEGQSDEVTVYCDEMKVNKIESFRIKGRPSNEEFYSSPENRERFERIILQKSLYLYNQAGEGRSARMRPLGYGLQSHKTLGFGAFCFTYRNVPFNTPLVFWYAGHGWIPLFERNFTSYENNGIFSILNGLLK